LLLALALAHLAVDLADELLSVRVHCRWAVRALASLGLVVVEEVGLQRAMPMLVKLLLRLAATLASALAFPAQRRTWA